MSKKVRRFRVFLDKQVPGVDVIDEIVTVPADATEEEIEEECNAVLDAMLSNDLCTGWEEIEDDEDE